MAMLRAGLTPYQAIAITNPTTLDPNALPVPGAVVVVRPAGQLPKGAVPPPKVLPLEQPIEQQATVPTDGGE